MDLQALAFVKLTEQRDKLDQSMENAYYHAMGEIPWFARSMCALTSTVATRLRTIRPKIWRAMGWFRIQRASIG